MDMNNRALGVLLLIGALIISVMGVILYFYASDYAGYMMMFMGVAAAVTAVLLLTGRIGPQN